MSVTKVERWQCSCGVLYEAEEAARACDAQEETKVANIGDIVIIDRGYCWFDGDSQWIASRTKSKGSRDGFSYAFYYVVVDVDRVPYERHRYRYHVRTRACAQAQGWTTASGHFPFQRADDVPAFVLRDAKTLAALGVERADRERLL